MHRVRRVAGQRETSTPQLPDRTGGAQRRRLIGIRLTRAQLGQPTRPGRCLLNAGDGHPVTVTVPSLPRDTNQARDRRGIGKLAKSRGISDDDRITRAVPPDEA